MTISIVSSCLIEAKYIDRNHVKVNASIKLNESIYDMWLHTVFYYRFNRLTYSKFPIDLWEDLCGWIAGTTKSYIADWLLGKYVHQYTNFNHTSPYFGEIFLKINNISTTFFGFEQLLPAGKYRVEANFTNEYRKNLLMMANLVMTVSDNCIEQF